MSPAKRLSRQRFRALCERCAMWQHDCANAGGSTDIRTWRFIVTLRRRHDGLAYEANRTVAALARLAR